MSEMLDKMKEILENGEDTPAEEIVDPTPPLEEALERAIYSLREISLYATYGRAAECQREASETLEVLNALKAKHEEQTKMMDILSGRDPETPSGYA